MGSQKPVTVNRQVQKDSLTAALKEANKEGEIVGFSVAIIDENKILYNEGFGMADVHNNKKYEHNTVQNIASISKTLIGISLLKAKELGKLELDDPINDYLPFEVVNPHYPEIPITIRHLATHSSSIYDKEDLYLKSFILQKDEIAKHEVKYNHFNTRDKKMPLIDFLESCFSPEGQWYSPELFLKNKPGEKFEYSNFGANLCAMVIASATEMSYKEFTRKYILMPLKMDDSGWSIEEVGDVNRAKPYLFKGQQIAEYSCITYPDGGFFTSTTDLSKYLAELMKGYRGKGTLLKKESYEELFEKQFDAPIAEKGRFNVGLYMAYNQGFLGSKDLLIGHNGSDLGVLTMMYFNPVTRIGKILFMNTDIDYKEETVIPPIKAIWKTIMDFENKLN